MTSPSMQPERNKGKPAAGAAHKPGGRPRRLDGDPGQSVSVGLVWSTGGVTVSFGEAPSSAAWNGSFMSQRANTSGLQWTGSGRLASNGLSAVIGGSTYSSGSIANGATSATLQKQ